MLISIISSASWTLHTVQKTSWDAASGNLPQQWLQATEMKTVRPTLHARTYTLWTRTFNWNAEHVIKCLLQIFVTHWLSDIIWLDLAVLILRSTAPLSFFFIHLFTLASALTCDSAWKTRTFNQNEMFKSTRASILTKPKIKITYYKITRIFILSSWICLSSHPSITVH